VTLSGFLFVAGGAVLSFALFTCQAFWLRKLGLLLLIASTALLGWVLFASPWAVAAGITLWLMLPWVEILTRVRTLRLPAGRQLRPPPPPGDLTPTLEEWTTDFEAAHFEAVDDVGWQWEDFSQFIRLLIHPGKRCHAMVSIAEQHELAFLYMAIRSRTRDGKVWTTWNYPFNSGLKRPPNDHLQRISGPITVPELLAAHNAFLVRNGVTNDDLTEPAPDQLPVDIQQELHQQIDHNLAAGLLVPAEEGKVRYGWRGLFYVYWQALCDIVRLA